MKNDCNLRIFAAALLAVLLILNAHGQTLGTAKAPADLLKATLLIESAETRTNTKYLPFGVYRQEGGKTIQITPTNVVVPVQQPETIFHGIGSGVLLTISNVNLFATAKHVVQQNEDVFFRIPQKGGGTPDHRPHRPMKAKSGTGWIFSTNADVALTIVVINQETDDISFIPLNLLAAKFESVSVGDDLFVSGFPSSVMELDAPALRSGMVAAKLPNDMILIDAFTFPGNSGGPVFWKPTMGINIYGNQVGEGRLACLIGLALYSPQYSEGAISPSSGRTRVVFESNSGLTEVISTSRILEVLEYLETKKALAHALGRE